MPQRHIIEARTNGAKAGFNSYLAAPGRKRESITEAGNKRAQFAAYCAIFGDQFEDATPATVTPAQSASTGGSLLDRFRRPKAEPKPASKPRERKPATVEVNGVTISEPDAPATFPQWVTLKKIGVTFKKGEV